MSTYPHAGSTTLVKDDPWAMALKQFSDVARRLNLRPGLEKFLATPQRELIVGFPVKMDDGRIEVFTGYRVHHSRVLGPTKGGIRFHPGVTLKLDVCNRATLLERHYGLVENLAEHVAQILLGEFHAPWVRVSIAKIGAQPNARRVGVVIERGRKQ